MANAITLPASIWQRLNIGWIFFFIITGFINIYVAYNFDTAVWVNFKVFGLLGLTLVFVVIQSFFIARHIKQDQEPGRE
jgi:intracellular septation protein